MNTEEYGLENAKDDHYMINCVVEAQRLTNYLMKDFPCNAFFVVQGGYESKENGFLHGDRSMPISKTVLEELEGEGETIEQAFASVSRFIPIDSNGGIPNKIFLKGYVSVDDTETYIQLPWEIRDKKNTVHEYECHFETSNVQQHDFVKELETACMKELPKEEENQNIFESFLGNRQKGGFDAAKVIRNLKDGHYDDEKVIAACVSALESKQRSSLAQKLVKQLQSDGILAKVFRKSGEFGTKEQ